MRILDKYLYKELSFSFLAVLAVLLLITFGAETTRVLTMAVEGRIPAGIVLQVLLLKVPSALEVILPLTVLLSVMLAYGRLYQDQEMVVLNSCGIGERYFQKQAVSFLLPLVLVTAFVTLWLTPWSLKTEKTLIAQAQVSAPIAGLVAGRFNRLPQDNGVLYAKEISAVGGLTEIWIRLDKAGNDTVLIAPSGVFETIQGRLALVLEQGQSYDGLVKGDDLVIREFDRLEVFIPGLEPEAGRVRNRELTTTELWQSDEADKQALLQWRLVLPISILVLGLLALKMSKTKPRQGRFAKIFIAILLYVVFIQLLYTSRDAASRETLSLWIGLWWVPLVFLAYVFYQPSMRLKKRLSLKKRVGS